VLKLFTEFLAACNRANVTYALPESSGKSLHQETQTYRDLLRSAGRRSRGPVSCSWPSDTINQPVRRSVG
jgi:hypothetical protein